MPSRWLPAFSMTLVSLISYVDRNTLALLAPTILRETGLSAREYGFIISAFSIAYMFGNPLWGAILDRVGVRRGMSSAVGIWTVASAAHAFASGPLTFGLARGVLGFGEGATFPGGLRTVIATLPATLRSRGIALAYSGGSLGAVITPLIVTPVAIKWGWRGAFWFTGLVGAAWLCWWAFISRRVDGKAIPLDAGAPRLAWRDARLWSFMAVYGLGGLPIAFILYGSSLYLSAVLGKSQGEIGRVLWIPPLGWEIGYFFWGWITDRFCEHGASITRMKQMFAVLAALSLPLALTGAIHDHHLVLLLWFFSMFVAAGFLIGSTAYASSLYSAGQAGVTAGLGVGSWSALVAVVMPVFGELFDLKLYGSAFAAAALCPLAGTILWVALNRR